MCGSPFSLFKEPADPCEEMLRVSNSPCTDGYMKTPFATVGKYRPPSRLRFERRLVALLLNRGFFLFGSLVLQAEDKEIDDDFTFLEELVFLCSQQMQASIGAS